MIPINQVSDIRQIETLLLEIDGLPSPKFTESSETSLPTVITCLENPISNLEHAIKLLYHDHLDFDGEESINDNFFYSQGWVLYSPKLVLDGQWTKLSLNWTKLFSLLVLIHNIYVN